MLKKLRRPDLKCSIVAGIAGQLERRVSFRRAMKQAMQRSLKAGAKGIKLLFPVDLGS